MQFHITKTFKLHFNAYKVNFKKMFLEILLTAFNCKYCKKMVCFLGIVNFTEDHMLDK